VIESHSVGPDGPYLTSREVADLLRLRSIRQVDRLRKDGRFPGCVKPGRWWLYPQSDVTAYMRGVQ
jgi:predicted DNA-binding transcriptional regulator AlpA